MNPDDMTCKHPGKPCTLCLRTLGHEGEHWYANDCRSGHEFELIDHALAHSPDCATCRRAEAKP